MGEGRGGLEGYVPFILLFMKWRYNLYLQIAITSSCDSHRSLPLSIIHPPPPPPFSKSLPSWNTHITMQLNDS